MNRKITLLVCLTLLFFSKSFAQVDAHYWTHQYGAKGLLLNGAVIASTEDETAIYYNPGAMGMDKDFGLSLSFFTPSYSILNTRNFLGNGNSFSDNSFSFAPSFGAIRFKLFNSDRISTGITTFERFRSDLRFRDRVVGLVESNEDQLFVGNLDFEKDLSERWYGFGIAFRIFNNLSFGVTQFASVHSEKANLTFQKEVFNVDQPNRLLFGQEGVIKYNFTTAGGLLTKLGLAWYPGNVKIGLTLTTPTYAIRRKSGSYEIRDFRKYGQDSTTVVSNFDNADFVDYKTPFSVGVGFDFDAGKTRVSISAEYFRKIKPYTLLEDEDDPFDGVVPNSQKVPFIIRTGNDQVINLALGFQKKLKGKKTLLWGFRTDFNQNSDLRLQNDFRFLGTTPDIFHFSIGGLFEVWRSQLSIGLDYAFGHRRGQRQLVNFSEISPENIFSIDTNNNVNTTFNSFIIFLTYDFDFKPKEENQELNEKFYSN